MAVITTPNSLNQGTEVVFDTTARTIQLVEAGNLSSDGVTLQALYSFTKDEWRTDANLIKFPFPFVAITGEQFELVNGWDFLGNPSKYLIREGGWALRDSGGGVLEEWMNITSLGLFDNSATDKAYFLQLDGGIPSEIQLSGEVNQAIQIFSDASLEDFNYRSFFRIYLREQGKTYGFYDLNAEQNIPTLTFRKYALPLVNQVDIKISVSDVEIDSDTDGTADIAPYSGMSIEFFDTAVTRDIGGTSYNFSIVINGNNATAEQIYEFVQWSLRQPNDINAGLSEIRGDTAEELLEFIGDTLRTKSTSRGGVYIDNFQTVDTNRLEFTDDTSTVRTFPFVSAGNLVFDNNLQDDPSSNYFVFFSNDDTGDNLGRDFGTVDAILINDNSGIPIEGAINSNSQIGFDFDYDGNIQRGTGSDATDAPYTAVALGTTTAQYVVATGTITRSVANVINFVSALERNYLSS